VAIRLFQKNASAAEGAAPRELVAKPSCRTFGAHLAVLDFTFPHRQRSPQGGIYRGISAFLASPSVRNRSELDTKSVSFRL